MAELFAWLKLLQGKVCKIREYILVYYDVPKIFLSHSKKETLVVTSDMIKLFLIITVSWKDLLRTSFFSNIINGFSLDKTHDLFLWA